MAMARPTTTAMISRTTTLLSLPRSGHGECYLGRPPGLLLEVDRHHRGLIGAGPQPGDGRTGFLRDFHRRATWLARSLQVDVIAEAQAGVGPGQRDPAGARPGSHRRQRGHRRAAVRVIPGVEPLRRVLLHDRRVDGRATPRRAGVRARAVAEGG